jgi:HPt (histidine-containing phosphotransfer) domain-containing protein
MYLPDIDVQDGTGRVMGNMNLYMRLLGKFDAKKMAEEIQTAAKAGDTNGVALAAHALRGTAANLGFPLVLKVTKDIEEFSKSGKDYSGFLDELETSVASLSEAITRFLG